MADIQSTSMFTIMKRSMGSFLSQTERTCFYEAAILHREALLDGVSFMGGLLERYAAEAQTQPDFNRDEVKELGLFLHSAIELVRCMEGVIDSYEP